MNERQLFESALEIADPQARQAFLVDACRGNPDLRARVDALLRSHATAGSFLDIPAADQMGQDVDNVTTNTIVVDSAADPEADHEPAESEFRKYLEPATRAGGLGCLGHYEIEAILGRGAFGIVAKAFDEKLHRVVAIKLLKPELAATSPPRKRFLREARTAAAVTHENIVAIHAVEEDPIPYLVMEFVPGHTLQQRMDQQGPLEIQEILRIGQQVAAGLAAAHAVNLIHRDIKPSNILLTGGPHDRAKISDFGLARAVDDATLTSSGLIAGTPMYMAPEQARGETLDHRADLFSLGSVLYQMASGRPPFRAANTVAVLKRVCEDTPRPLDDVIPGIPGWLETIVFRLLEKDRDARYQSAQEVADLLSRCQSELKHQGRVTCVPGDTAPVAETQDLPARKGNRTIPARRPIGWWVGGVTVLVVLAAIAVLMNAPTGSREATKQTSTNADTNTTASATNKKGWHGWPADAPAPAIAPFNADEARQHQEEWAKYLNVPAEYTNSIGMKFRLIPPGEFIMGSTPEEIAAAVKDVPDDKHWQECLKSQTPQHKVILTQPIYLGVNEVTQAEYEKVMGSNPSHFAPMGMGKEAVAGLETAEHPVEMVSWNDAAEFCAKLSKQEKLKPFYFRAGETITPLDGTGYRLPSEAEWEFACRAGTATKCWIGDKVEDMVQAGWFGGNSGGRTHAAGELKANPFGLSDIHGNVWEWVQDGWDATYYGQFSGKPATNPHGPFPAGSLRVIRGGYWGIRASDCRSSDRIAHAPSARGDIIGFRVSLTMDAVKSAIGERTPPVTSSDTNKKGWHGWPADAPPPAIAPFDAAQARKHQEEWAGHLKTPVEYTNTIGMKFRLIPPGEFMMGSTPAEIAAALPVAGNDLLWQDCIKSEGPRHKVILTQPTYLCMTEVTQSQYTQVMGKNPSYYAATGKWSEYVTGIDTSTFPVEGVTWDDATEFCGRLIATEQLESGGDTNRKFSSPFGDAAYRLPSEVEWEFACRAGTESQYYTGNTSTDLSRAAWCVDTSGKMTHAVGELQQNSFGLYDMHGNVWEWTLDTWNPVWYSTQTSRLVVNPFNRPVAGAERMTRGGNYSSNAYSCRSASRCSEASGYSATLIGFRVALSVDAVRQALKVSGPAMPQSSVSNSKPASAGWPSVDVLALINVERDSIGPRWVRKESALESPGGTWPKLQTSYALPADYRIDAELERLEGKTSAHFGLTVGGHPALLVLDGIEKSGLEFVDAPYDSAANPTHVARSLLPSNKRVAVQIEVHPASVRVSVDRETVIDWKGVPSSLVVRKEAVTPEPSRLTISTYSQRFRWHRLQVTPLDRAQTANPAPDRAE